MVMCSRSDSSSSFSRWKESQLCHKSSTIHRLRPAVWWNRASLANTKSSWQGRMEGRMVGSIRHLGKVVWEWSLGNFWIWTKYGEWRNLLDWLWFVFDGILQCGCGVGIQGETRKVVSVKPPPPKWLLTKSLISLRCIVTSSARGRPGQEKVVF